MDDTEKSRPRSDHGLRLVSTPEPQPLSRREARSLSKELSRIGQSISATRLEDIYAGSRATRDEIASLQALNQHSSVELPILRDRASRLQELKWRLIICAVLVWTVLLGLYFITHASELAHAPMGL